MFPETEQQLFPWGAGRARGRAVARGGRQGVRCSPTGYRPRRRAHPQAHCPCTLSPPCSYTRHLDVALPSIRTQHWGLEGAGAPWKERRRFSWVQLNAV